VIAPRFESPPFMLFSRAKGAVMRAPVIVPRFESRAVVRAYDDSGRIVWRGSSASFVIRERTRARLGLPLEARSWHHFDRAGRLTQEYAFHSQACSASGPLDRPPRLIRCSCGLRARSSNGGAR
jgi:hypothetical protein